MSAPTTPSRLYHAVSREVWEEALREGAYLWSTRGVPFEAEGFVHLSRADQVDGTLTRFFDDLTAPMVVLVIDPSRTEAEIRMEDGFFHLYGLLIIPAVVNVLPVERGDDGRWHSPV